MLRSDGQQGEDMARSTIGVAFAALALAACGPKAATTPDAAPSKAPAVVAGWYTATGPAIGPDPISVEIHPTKNNGLQGRIWSAEETHPLRNLVIADGAISFIVPALDASYSGRAGEPGYWSGKWTTKDDTQPAALMPGPAPDLKGKAFVTLGDGRQMFLDCRGQGSPVVVFDSGAGATTTSWAKVHDEIAKTTRACAYDRAGHGLSDPRALPLDAAAVADDLDAMLTAAHVPAPYVLVGHSLGSYHVRQFANTRLDKVAGIVLVDPSGDNQDARFTAVMPDVMAKVDKMQAAGVEAGCAEKLRAKLVRRDDPLAKTCEGNDAEAFEAGQSEIDAMTKTSLDELTKSKRSYGALPLIVLTRGDYKAGMPPFATATDIENMKRVWIAMHQEMTKLSTVGENRTVPKAGHGIQRDQPQAVIQAVNDVVAKVRAGAAKP
jgi:pimeloyl-ACP methyl ester carboxylesterase